MDSKKGRVIIVSNRLPIEVEVQKEEVRLIPSVGGLATGLSSFHPKEGSLWIGWVGIPEEEMPNNFLKDELLTKVVSESCIPVSLTEKEIDDYYYGFSNKVIWPLFHYFTEFVNFDQRKWEAYQKVNKKFAEEIQNYLQPNDMIWVHDYHFMLLPALLKNKRKDSNIGFFLHIPFPSFEIFRTLPVREEILEGLLGADLIGFHTYDYQQHFLENVERILSAKVEYNKVIYKGHTTYVNVYPMGIDSEKFKEEAEEQAKESYKGNLRLKKELEEYAERNPGLKYILSIDRMDYTKGIVTRIRAFDYFLSKNPSFIGKVRLIMLAVPSRTELSHYQLLKKEIDELVGRINSKYATISWSPILYFYRSFPFEDLVELYAACEVALITPVRDGMNLVAKEYVMSRVNRDGVLILSEMAGAAKEMPEALLINPLNFDQISEAMVKALNMPEEEQEERMSAMQERIFNYTVKKWARNFMNDLKNEEGKRKKESKSAMEHEVFQSIIEKYEQSKCRLILLDYDGTLTGFTENPMDAVPDKELYEVLEHLGLYERNQVYIISGRAYTDIEAWFSSSPVHLIAEHGVYRKTNYHDWISHPGLDNSWKEHVRPLLEKFVAHTPGSFIEEKSHSLAWHYRKAKPSFGVVKARELLGILNYWSGSLNTRVLDGNKVVEITNSMVNKGTAVTDLVQNGNIDFILAIGDDHTDELLFAQLPDSAVSIKVGEADTIASYRLKDFQETRKFLKRLIENDRKRKRNFPT